jgi:hypothetical protein
MPNIGGNVTHTFSPTLVNEMTIGLNLWTEEQKLTDKDLAALQRATYGINIPQAFPKNNPLGLLPAMSFGGITNAATVSYDGRFPMVDDATALTFSDGLSKVWNQHLFKVGLPSAARSLQPVSSGRRKQFPRQLCFWDRFE